jgi:hypothetical protein
MKCDGKKLATWGVVVLIAYAAIAGIFRAASTPFWPDELCTVAIARQPDMAAIWKALGVCRRETFRFGEKKRTFLAKNV